MLFFGFQLSYAGEVSNAYEEIQAIGVQNPRTGTEGVDTSLAIEALSKKLSL